MSNLIPASASNPIMSLPEILPTVRLPAEILAAIKNNVLAQLEIIPNNDGVLKAFLQVGDKNFVLPLSDNLISALENEPQSIPVKISGDGKLQIIRPEPRSVEEPVIAIAKSDNVPLKLSPVKIRGFAEQTLKELDVPKETRSLVIRNLPTLQFSVEQIGARPADDNAVLKPLLAVLQKIAKNPSEVHKLQPELVRIVNELAGKQTVGEISGQINNKVLMIKTPFGETLAEGEAKLPPEEPLLLNISILQPEYGKGLQFVDSLLKLILPEKEAIIKPENLLKLPQLKNFEILALPENHETLAMIAAKMPLQNGHIMENMYNFYQGAVNKDLSRWLDAKTLKNLAADSVNGKGIVQELNNMLSASLKETSVWRIVEMPLFDGTQFAPLKIAVKKDAEKEKNMRKKQKNGTRFIVETQFSKLGNFQFDGFSNSQKRSLDLIVRTSALLPDDFCSNLINLFKKSLYALSYAGSIKINRQESFINLQEENFITEGIYI